MTVPVRWSVGGAEVCSSFPSFPSFQSLLDRNDRASDWEIEIGFGKGRYLRRASRERPGTRFLGIERVGEYFHRLVRFARRDSLSNLVVVQAEALYLLAALLPRESARAVHVYFPDPWPKSRHQRRRLFDEESVDLVVGLLAPGATLFFATDFVSYGESVERLLRGYPGLAVERRTGDWPDGARTNYEAKYQREGRSFVRLIATRATGASGATPWSGGPHPGGERSLASAYRADPAGGEG